jgi:hypothetical protein
MAAIKAGTGAGGISIDAGEADEGATGVGESLGGVDFDERYATGGERVVRKRPRWDLRDPGLADKKTLR